jgi:hypothetical protein
MTCTETITIIKDAHLIQDYEDSKKIDCNASEEYKPEPLIYKIRKAEPKPSFLFGYVDV